MSAHINFDAKTDRELLVLAVQRLNEIYEVEIPDLKQRTSLANGKGKDLELRLTKLETKCTLACADVSSPEPTSIFKRNAKIGGYSAGGAAAIYGILEIILKVLSG